MTVEIVLLAMIALFVGLRLYAVLGQRTGHEQQPVIRPEAPVEAKPVAPVADVPANAAEPLQPLAALASLFMQHHTMDLLDEAPRQRIGVGEKVD